MFLNAALTKSMDNSTEQVVEGFVDQSIYDEEGAEEEWVEEEIVVEEVEVIEEDAEDVQNVQIDENDLDEADFMDDDDGFDDEFGDDDDADGWGDDDDAMDVDGADQTTANPSSTFVPSMVADSMATSLKALPHETIEAINRNCDEINMLPMFSCVPDLNAPAQFKGISRDQLTVWGLADYQYIAIRLKLGRYYLHETTPPSVEVGATNHISDVGLELDPFRIAWTLQDRCKNAFFCAADWHQNIKMNDIPDSSKLNDLMESTNRTYAQCLDALKKNKFDVTKTSEYLLSVVDDTTSSTSNSSKPKRSIFRRDKRNKSSKSPSSGPRIDIDTARRRFVKKLNESTAAVDPLLNSGTQKQREKEWVKKAQSTTNEQRIQQLAEIFALDYGVVELAVESLGYDYAAEQLTDETVRAQYISQFESVSNSGISGISGVSGFDGGHKSGKQSWWGYGGGDSKEQEYDDERYKPEKKVWDNLVRSCDMIPNYENMAFVELKEDAPDSVEVEIDYERRTEEIQSKLMLLGIVQTDNRILHALKKTNNDTDDVVINWILEHQKDVISPEPESVETKNDEESEDEEAQIARKRMEQKKRAARERKRRMLEMGPAPRLSRTVSDSQIHLITDGNEALEAISLMFDHNFFVVLIHYILKQLLNSTQNCMICGQRLEYPGLKPTICLSPFCQFRLLEIGLGGGDDGGYGLGAEILGNSDICDFLICCACAAAGNPQRSSIFFPEQVRGATDETANESFMQSDGTTPDVEKLKKVINLCPAIDDMKGWARQGEWSLKEELGKLHCLLYPYLIWYFVHIFYPDFCWVINSNRAYLMKLPDDKRIPQIKTDHQFVMRSQTPERAEAFNNKKSSNGSVFYAWHGSGIYNWHSILRMGLKNYSNTKYMSAGAAYGAGIYTAEQSSTSLGYCTRGGGGISWQGSRFGQNVCCMALCEIVGPKSKWDKNNGIYVISDEDCVATRYFFLFDSTNGLGGLSANSLTLPKWEG